MPAGADALSPEIAEIISTYAKPDASLDPVMRALRDGQITLGPAPPPPGSTMPASVPTGYLILRQDLPSYDITDTPEAQEEIARFLARLKDTPGVSTNPNDYLVYLLPDIVVPPLPQPTVNPRPLPTVSPEALPSVSPTALPSVGTYGKLPNIRVGPLPSPTIPSLGDSAEVIEDPAHALPIDTGVVDEVIEAEDGPLSSALVVPATAPVELVGAVYADNVIYVKTLLSSSPVPGVEQTVPEDDPSGSARWEPAGGLGCLRRKQNRTAWFDPCSFFYHHTNDGDRYKQTYALKQFGTGKSKGAWDLNGLEVESWRKKDTAEQWWMDWDPGADSDFNCQSQTIGINVRAVYLESTHLHCEEWDIDKGSAPADFSNWWRGDVPRKERETAALIATSVKNGEWPVDYVDFDYYA